MSLRIYGNRVLKTLPGKATRPTPSRVREAVFNILQGQIEDCRWLDLCSGMGTMGAEALARGAAFVLGIERERDAVQVIEENWLSFGPERSLVIRSKLPDALNTVQRKQEPFDIIYFDPPYQSDLYEHVVPKIDLLDLLLPQGVLLCEHHRGRVLPKVWGRLTRVDYRTYGETCISFYQGNI
jgi:16S rRNA (guanine966-N2)-methyltransferase